MDRKFWVVHPEPFETGIAGPFTETEAREYIDDSGGERILLVEAEPPVPIDREN